ncbi:ATP-binding mismatch repair protein [Sporobolomyces koalae]|uniref:ATP-binding mismatch repair protein n=1 Tax=Sporobolomyces koalae TaxID=500713 RepID=UPI00317C0241
MSIQAIDRSSIHSLTSGQVIIDLQTAVKELVENALDAGATSIDVKFKEHGTESIEVSDNGKGIDKADWAGIALKHHTSKLSSFADLASVSTLGFRGEALSSLCGTASLSLVTSTAATAPVGTSLTFTRSGECVIGGKAARPKGTTIRVDKLFETVPVRRKELIKNAKREFGKALELLQAYALVSTGVRFEVKNTTKSKTMTHLQAPAAPSLRSNFSSIFAPKSLQTMMDINLDLEVPADKSVTRWTEGAPPMTEVKVIGLISKPSPGNGRTSGNRQFYYINGRPFHPSRIARAVNEVYKSFVPGSFPSVVADFQLATDAYDVNVSPDKRTIFLHSEGNLIAALKSALEEFFRPSQSTFEMIQIDSGRSAKEAASGRESESLPASEADTDTMADERPKKRRKTEDSVGITGSGENRLIPMDSTGTSRAPTDDVLDVEIDASLFASSSAYRNALPPEFAAAFDSAQSFELPNPPSPKRRASEIRTLSSKDDDRPIASTSSSPSPSEDHDAQEMSTVPTSSRTTPVALEHSRDTDSRATTPLFRSSPSPSPLLDAEPEVRPVQSRSAPHPTSPSSPLRPAVARPARLRQPQLAFVRDTPTSMSAVSACKGEGKPQQSGLQSFRAIVQHSVNPSASGRTSRDDQEEVEEVSLDEEIEDEEPLETTKRDDLLAVIQRPRSDSLSGEPEGCLTARRNRGNRQAQSEQDVGEEEDDVEMEIVESSFREAEPVPEHDEEEDELEVIASSCACVHGSPIEESRQPSLDGGAMRNETASIVTPFGGAPAEIAGVFVAADTTLTFDSDLLDSVWSAPVSPGLVPYTQSPPSTASLQDLVGAGIEESEDTAAATLSRVVTKDDFDAMSIIGQFNLGFIIARRTVMEKDQRHDDLFIVDQHASDEKYNFEKLQAETVIQSQRLLAPRVLNLPSHDELTAIEHLDLLRLNGYDVVIDEDADVGERVKLSAQPVSNKTVFDIADFEELLDLIKTRAGTEIIRPSKTRKMFASRACRKSVMIGKALNAKQMASIVRHMGQMDQPWACPHGRPTMRWLAGMSGAPEERDPRADVQSLLEAYDSENIA